VRKLLPVVALLAFTSVARAGDARVEKLGDALAEGEEGSWATSPELKAEDADETARAALALFAAPETKFEVRIGPEKRPTKSVIERAVRFPSQIQKGVPSDVVTGVYFAPAEKSDARLPACVVLHHSGGSFEAEAVLARHLARHGVPSITIDLPNYGPRKLKGSKTGFLNGEDPTKLHEGFVQAVVDVRRAADFLRSRAEVDPARVGVIGISLGAIVGATTAGVDGRFSKAVLTIGGGDLAKILAYSAEAAGAREKIKEKGISRELLDKAVVSVDPCTFAHRIRSETVLMLNAAKDEIIPRESTDSLWRKIGQPAIRWYDCGHYGIVAHLLDIMSETLDAMKAEPAAPSTAW
jgi:dienelactone hydrolase